MQWRSQPMMISRIFLIVKKSAPVMRTSTAKGPASFQYCGCLHVVDQEFQTSASGGGSFIAVPPHGLSAVRSYR
jgi:hypothetical protein